VITDKPSFPDETIYDRIEIRQPSAEWQTTEFGEDIKSTYFQESPFEQTLFLDSDTYVVDAEAINELFALLDEYDLAAAHDSARSVDQAYPNRTVPTENAPETFPWLNIGVVAFNQTSTVEKFFAEWRELYHEQNEVIKGINDQSSFTEALYESDVIHTVLPPEYNHHVPYPHTNRGRVRIVHGHFPNLEEIATFINEVVTEENPYPLQAIRYEVRKKGGELWAEPIRAQARQKSRDEIIDGE
jgi:hypothetical protein